MSEKYKKDPQLQVYIDNQFIDEYTIQEFNSRQNDWYCDLAHWIYDYKKNWMWYSGFLEMEKNKIPRKLFDPKFHPGAYFPRKFKCYLIDDDILKKSRQILLHVINDDSNYTNGFMTRSTLINLSKIFLIPQRYLKFFDREECVDVRHEFNNRVVPTIYNHDKDNNEKNYKLVNGLYQFQEERYREGYPFAMKFFWNGKEIKDLYSIGGSGTLSVNLKKNEHGIVMLDQSHNELFQKYTNGKLEGFPMSERFFNIASNIKFNKYL